MLVRFRSRLTYANVVATLALFLALGGSAYAAVTITSKNVKDRSLRGKDLKRNTVTGTEVEESKLGPVKNAQNAQNALTSVTAQNALTSVTAQNALTSDTAQTAANAQNARFADNSSAVGGVGVADLEKSSRTLFGTATATPASQSAEGVLFQWEGVRVAVPAQGGCNPVQRITLRITNTNQSGADVHVYGGGSLDSDLSPGSETIACSDELRRWIGAITHEDNKRTLFFSCFRLGPDIRCIATQSAP